MLRDRGRKRKLILAYFAAWFVDHCSNSTVVTFLDHYCIYCFSNGIFHITQFPSFITHTSNLCRCFVHPYLEPQQPLNMPMTANRREKKRQGSLKVSYSATVPCEYQQPLETKGRNTDEEELVDRKVRTVRRRSAVKEIMVKAQCLDNYCYLS